ncbi:acyltransferase [Thiosulfatimonas sediminis]|nr:acyltransferase [Thiosulfatimonas sediminis]
MDWFKQKFKKLWSWLVKARHLHQYVVLGALDQNQINIGKNSAFKGLNAFVFKPGAVNNRIEIGDNFRARKLQIIFKGQNNQVIIGDNVKWSGRILVDGCGLEVRIGENTTAESVYLLSRDQNVTIGKNCMISREIEIRSTDVHKIYLLETGQRVNEANPLIVGDHVWIAARAFLSKNTVIPNNCVIGACSFVNKAFTEENTIIAGSPAKVVKRGVDWKR